jgi:hypothetical protein
MVKRQSDALVGVRTYGLDGSFQHRQSANTAFGVNYSHIHYDFSSGFGESDINLIQGFWTRSFGRLWIVAVHGGVYQSEVSGLELVPLDPFFAQLFGTSAIVAGFYRSNVFPSADVTATRSFKNSGLTMSYSRSISGGNGVYLTSRQELAGVSYAYTGIRKWSFTAGVNYGRLNAISQGLAPYSQYSGGVGASYAVSRALYATAHYDARHYEIQDNPFQRTASRFTVGLTFSPGDLPLSFR